VPEHSIFGASPYPGTLTLFTDGTPSILVTNGFYTFTEGAAGWRCVGARVYVPAGVELSGPVPVGMWAYAGAGTGPDLTSAPVASGEIATPVTGWNEVRWTPVEVTPGTPFWVGYDLGAGRYLAATDLGADFIRAADDATVVLGEQNMSGLGSRGYFRIGDEPVTSGAGGNGYGLDVIIDEGASDPETHEATATLGLSLGITATARKLASAGASLSLELSTAPPSAEKAAAATASLALELSTSAAARKLAAAEAALTLALSLAASVPVDVAPTPAVRTLVVEAEHRLAVIRAELRATEVPAETRLMEVPA
jgi:hypothetical protein